MIKSIFSQAPITSASFSQNFLAYSIKLLDSKPPHYAFLYAKTYAGAFFPSPFAKQTFALGILIDQLWQEMNTGEGFDCSQSMEEYVELLAERFKVELLKRLNKMYSEPVAGESK